MIRLNNYIEYGGHTVVVMLCSSCNISCKHCYISYSGDFSYEQADTIITKLQKKYRVVLNGSEILSKPEYLPLLKKVTQTGLMTNGIAIANNPSILILCKENGVDTIEISYHFSLHDMISPVPKELILNVISLCRKNGFKVTVMTSVSKINNHGIRNMCDEAFRIGANSIKFTNFLDQGAAKRNNLYSIVLQQDEIDRVLYEIDECRSLYDKSVLYIERCGSFGPRRNSSKKRFYCPAVKDVVVLTPELMVYPCIFLAKPGYEIGLYNSGKILLKNDETDYCEDICSAKKYLTILLSYKHRIRQSRWYKRTFVKNTINSESDYCDSSVLNPFL